MELINVALQLSVYVEMRFKHALGCWRPCDLSAQVQPLITTPGHGSLPSGHATQAYVVAEVLRALRGWGVLHPRDEQLQRQAARIATNRVVAGVHFPVDSLAGRLLGQTLGEYFVARCRADGPVWKPRRFDGAAVPPQEDLEPAAQSLGDGRSATATPYYVVGQPFGVPPPNALLRGVWDRAAGEWS